MSLSVSSELEDFWWLFGRLQRYEHEHGSLPYGARGSEYALYKLRADLLTFPERSPRHPLEWDEESGKAANLRYDYVNRPDLRLDNAGREPYVVAADKLKGATKRAVMYLISSGRRSCGRSGGTSGMPARTTPPSVPCRAD